MQRKPLAPELEKILNEALVEFDALKSSQILDDVLAKFAEKPAAKPTELKKGFLLSKPQPKKTETPTGWKSGFLLKPQPKKTETQQSSVKQPRFFSSLPIVKDLKMTHLVLSAGVTLSTFSQLNKMRPEGYFSGLVYVLALPWMKRGLDSVLSTVDTVTQSRLQLGKDRATRIANCFRR